MMEPTTKTPQTNNKSNRPPWWFPTVAGLLLAAVIWIQTLVNTNREDLKAQITEGSEREAKLATALAQNNIMVSNVIILVREVLNLKNGNENFTNDSINTFLSGQGNRPGNTNSAASKETRDR